MCNGRWDWLVLGIDSTDALLGGSEKGSLLMYVATKNSCSTFT